MVFLLPQDVNICYLMHTVLLRHWALVFLFFSSLFAATPVVSLEKADVWCWCGGSGDYFRDVETVRCIDSYIHFRYPTSYNFNANGGYFVTPYARGSEPGVLAVGWASQPPYSVSNFTAQLTRYVEVSLNYRIFNGVPDYTLSAYGFGDLSDKGANAKIIIIHPEDSDYLWPGVAIGFEDFLGTKAFNSSYVVATKVFRDYNIELSAGYGVDRLQGFFGGIGWTPFLCWENPWITGLQLVAEYDPVDYEDPLVEHHPDGRVKSSFCNYGLKWRLFDGIELNAAHIRGEEFAGSISVAYNLGECQGFIPKIWDSLPYTAPCDTEPIGLTRDRQTVVEDFAIAFKEQGFFLLDTVFAQDECNRRQLKLGVCNVRYRRFCEQRDRITRVVTNLCPCNIDDVIVVIKDVGLPIHEFHFRQEDLFRRLHREIGEFELAVLSPIYDVNPPDFSVDTLAYKVPNKRWSPYLYPDFDTLWGSARGKFKYSFNADIGFVSMLMDNLFLSVNLNYQIVSDMDDVGAVDMLNPSQLVNVRSDSVRYYQESSLALTQGFLQGHWNLGCGLFARGALGYFERAYGGVAAELLWAPVASDWALGLSGATLWKREYSGLKFTDDFTQYTLWTPRTVTHHPNQWFFDVYYDWRWAQLEFKLSVGQFLLHDFGAKFVMSRYFPSGLRLFGWYARTNQEDYINGERYYDKGIGITVYPDVLFGYSCRKQIGYAISAWTRDIAAEAATGIPLYDLVHGLRHD